MSDDEGSTGEGDEPSDDATEDTEPKSPADTDDLEPNADLGNDEDVEPDADAGDGEDVGLAGVPGIDEDDGDAEADAGSSEDDTESDDDEDGPEVAATTSARGTRDNRTRPKRGAPAGQGRPRSSGSQRGGKGRRRRLTPMHGVVAVTLILLVAWIVKLVTDDDKASGWDWILLGVAIAAFGGAVFSFLDQKGVLLRYKKRGLGALTLVLGLALASLVTVIATGATPELGLDLQGGFSVVLEPDGSPPSDNIDKAMEIIRQRIDGLGVAEPEVTRQGDNVVVELPGVKDRRKAQELVGRTAKLEFRPVVQPGLPFDEKAAARGDDPCAALSEPTEDTTTTTTAESTTSEPGATTPSSEGGTPSTESSPSSETTTPETSEGDGQQGAGPAGPSGITDGDNAAAPPGRQADTTTTTTTTTTSTPDVGTTTSTTPPAEEGAAGEAEPDTVIYPTQEREGEPRTCVAMGPVGFEGDSLSKAKAELGGQTGGEWVVSVSIKGSRKDEANELFNACYQGGATCPAQGERGLLAIALDRQVVSAPQVNSMNLADEQFQITGGEGGFPQAEAKDLALVLRYGALPVEFTPSAERRVSPTLGENSLRAGILAGVLGLIAVFLYLIFYYRALGLVVLVGVGVWASLMYGVVCWLSASRGLTLSLAGVVGIVVSLGTTVDSYIVHFERLKDEVRIGKSVRASTERGFQRAFRTILTADLASLLGASLLWWLTVGSVRGFAFFLGLSITLDLFVAYCFDRPVVALLARNEFFTENRFFGVARGLGRSSDGPPAPAAAVARA